MKRLIAALALVSTAALAVVVTTTPGTWDLYRGSTNLGSYSGESACAQAAGALGVVRKYTCRTSTAVAVTASPLPAAPTVAITASPASVDVGVASILSWSSTNAADCTASGAWAGVKPTSGTASTGPISAQSIFTLTCTGAGGSTANSATVSINAPTGAMLGLEWSGNESTNIRRMLYWSNPFAQYPATYVFRVLPKGPKAGPNPRYWTTFFWAGHNGTFGGYPFYGAHPYPNPAPDGSSQPWEISVNFNDYLGPVPTWNRWHTQVFRAWRDANGYPVHQFIYDYDAWVSSGGTQGVMSHTVEDASYGISPAPSNPAIVVGQAPAHELAWTQSSWGGYVGYEEFKGVIRGLQFYDARLTDAQVASEIANPGSARSPWFLNLNPTPSDVTDKSGNGHHGAWEGTGRPALWSN